MSRVSYLEIFESEAQLKTLLAEQTNILNFQKIQVLYFYKIGKIKTVKNLASTLNRNRATIHRWLKIYREQGIESLLQEHTKVGRPTLISKEAITALQFRLRDSQSQFVSYTEVCQWLSDEYQVFADYKTVYSLIKYKLKLDLKLARNTVN